MLHFKLRTNKTTATIHKENQIFYTCQKKEVLRWQQTGRLAHIRKKH